MSGVERPLTIAVTGAHSTGKSTFLARLAHRLRQHDLEVATVADLGEQAQQIGLPILHSHTYTSTLWIMTRGISNELATWPHADVLLVDRPVPDALGYYLAALIYRGETPDPTLLGHLRTLAAQHSMHYDLIFRTELDHTVPLGTNKARDDNIRYRRLADHHIATVLHDLGIGYELLAIDGHDTAITRATAFTLTQHTGDDLATI
ncbi:AAA family ATPase [Pseudonocardia sp. MH-G8]|uniref:AAA family ATPase n=1 Tax=Pseudonocardia sp. MH-G8 TaxID=1854588 RepID=UPI0013044A53|nr:AAA family ATPase [Pseudonocardia sp. MH-G8]